MVSSVGFLEESEVVDVTVGLLVGEDTWSLVIGLWKLEVGMEVKLGKRSLEETLNEWWVIEVVAVVLEVVGGVRIGMEAIRGDYDGLSG